MLVELPSGEFDSKFAEELECYSTTETTASLACHGQVVEGSDKFARVSIQDSSYQLSTLSIDGFINPTSDRT